MRDILHKNQMTNNNYCSSNLFLIKKIPDITNNGDFVNTSM